MKVISKIFIFVFLFLFLSLPVLAQNASPTANQLRETRIEQETETIQHNIQDQTSTRTARLTEQKRNIIRNHYQKMMKRLYTATVRLENILTRIESRIEKIETEDEQIDLSDTKTQIEKIKIDIDQIMHGLMPQAQDKFEEMNGDQNPGKIMPEIKEIVKETKNDIIAVHQNLIEIVKELKSLKKN